MNTTSHPLIILLFVTFAVSFRVQAAVDIGAIGLLIKWRDGPASAAATAGNAQIGAKVKQSFPILGWQLVELPAGMSVSAGLGLYGALEAVVAVEANRSMEPIRPRFSSGANSPAFDEPGVQAAALQAGWLAGVVPNDHRFPDQWNLQLIDMTNAWAASIGSPDVVVALFDSGMDYTHQDLRDNAWRNPGETGLDDQGRDKATNGVDDDGNGYIDDVHGIDLVDGDSDPMDGADFFHGTACAGIIGATGNNGTGITGVLWSTRLMAVRMIRPTYPYIPFSYQLEAAEYVLALKQRGINVRVSNHSYGVLGFSRAIYDSLAALNAADVLTVFAAMNLGIDHDVFAHYETAYDLPLSIDVAATDRTDGLESYSNFGRNCVELAAPVSELTTMPGNSYSDFAGTSAAAPHVAGAAALLAAMKPEATAWEIRAALMHSVDQKTSLKNKVTTGGRLNVARAIEALTNNALPPIVVSVTPSTSRARVGQKIEVWFSQPMDRASVESAFEISPAQAGVFQWADDSTRFRFEGVEPLPRTNHTVRIRASAKARAGAWLDGDFDRVAQGTTIDDYVWGFGFAPRNDDFNEAQILANDTGSVKGNNFNASRIRDEEPLSPLFEHPRWWYEGTLWYRWTASQDGWITFETSETAVDTFLTTYAGDTLSHLSEVAFNDNDGARLVSRLSFGAMASTNYSIVLDGQHQTEPLKSMGPFTLRWYPTPRPAIRNFRPSSAYPSQAVTINGTNFSGATRVLLNGVPATFAFGTNANLSDLQLIATVPFDATTGPITIETPHGNVTTVSNLIVLDQPKLTMRLLPELNLVELSWVSTAGFTAQRTDALGPAAQWVSAQFVSTWLTNNNTVSAVTVTNASLNRFFRLRKP